MHGVHFICSNINLAEKIHSRYTSWPFHSTVSSLISCNTATFWWTFVDFFFFQFLYVFDDTWFMCDAKKFNEARTSFVGNISLSLYIYIYTEPNNIFFTPRWHPKEIKNQNYFELWIHEKENILFEWRWCERSSGPATTDEISDDCKTLN